MKIAVSWVAFLGTLGVVLALADLGLSRGIPDWAIVFSLTVWAGAWLLVLQRLRPFSESWRGWREAFGVDLAHSIVSTMGATSLFKALALGFVVTASDAASRWVGVTVWPESWPMPVQLGLALVVGEFGSYWFHRACHEVPVLWRVHALHHSSERLHMLASGRTHPLNAIGAYACGVVPLIALGARGEVLVLVSLFTAVHGMMQHTNVDLKLGALEYVFSGPDLHRWHHSVRLEESCTNYGSNLIFWDIVFGTRFKPRDRRPYIEVGLPDMDWGRDYFRHLAGPFAWARLRR